MLHQGERGLELDRQTRELEAEAVATVVCAHFGYEVKGAAYIALWKGDSKAILGRLDTIRQTASTIIKEVEGYVVAANEV